LIVDLYLLAAILGLKNSGSFDLRRTRRRRTDSDVIVSSQSTNQKVSTDEIDSEESDFDSEDESFEGLRENKLVRTLLEDCTTIPKCQTLWGMRDVDLKINPEAMDVIANQATDQNAGVEGVRNIMEKLLLAVRFELPSVKGKVEAVEITEDFVQGKAPPIYHLEGRKKAEKCVKDATLVKFQPLEFTEFEEAIAFELEHTL